jgi:hypothetical protein
MANKKKLESDFAAEIINDAKDFVSLVGQLSLATKHTEHGCHTPSV